MSELQGYIVGDMVRVIRVSSITYSFVKVGDIAKVTQVFDNGDIFRLKASHWPVNREEDGWTFWANSADGTVEIDGAVEHVNILPLSLSDHDRKVWRIRSELLAAEDAREEVRGRGRCPGLE